MATSTSARPRARARRKIYCPHCEESVSHATYYRHRERFYDHRNGQWAHRSQEQKEAVTDGCDISSCGDDLSMDSMSSPDQSLQDDYSPDTPSGQLNELSSTDPSITDDTSSSNGSNNDTNSTVEDMEEEYWPSEESESENEEIPQCNSTPLIKHFLIFAFLWQFLFRVSNSAIACLLRFMKYFIKALGVAFHCNDLVVMASSIPLSLKTVHRMLGIVEQFESYVVCPSCQSVYHFKDCLIRQPFGQSIAKSCCHVPYPRHPQRSRRSKCGAKLLKVVNGKNGMNLRPIKVYPYLSLEKSMGRLVKRQGFLEACELWRKRSRLIPSGYLGDIFDGRVWNDFNSPVMQNFLSSPHCYLLTMNVDWFQPYERKTYSLGAIYLSIQNLPRDVRFKLENIILVGVIPGPHEPSRTVNSYLTPLVIELQKAWTSGFSLPTCHGIDITVRLALSCVACDIPASRKVSGFLGHTAALGCNKCMKVFTTHADGFRDYSGYDEENWQRRDGVRHRQSVDQIANETTQTGISAAESRYGARYSVLLALPYFDAVRFTVVDVMHNLFLGTAKRMFQLWVGNDILSKQKLAVLEKRMSSFKAPSYVGRLPAQISSNYGGFTAKQWKNWILIYSPIVLKGLLPTEHLGCWLLFVRACHLICSALLRVDNIQSAHIFFVHFARRFEQLYGKESFTPNIHLHMHLKECLLDYGPPYAFWCFSFERYNGVLGSYHTNKREIECQFMRKFMTQQAVTCLPITADNPLHDLLTTRSEVTQACSSILDFCSSSDITLEALLLNQRKLETQPVFSNNGIVVALPPLRMRVFDADQFEQISMLYRQLYPTTTFQLIPVTYSISGRVTMCGHILGSVLPGGNNASSSVIMAFWPTRGDNILSIDYAKLSIGIVEYYIKHTIRIKQGTRNEISVVEHIFAFMKWMKRHSNPNFYGTSATVASSECEQRSMCSFLPVQRIRCLAAHSLDQIEVAEMKWQKCLWQRQYLLTTTCNIYYGVNTFYICHNMSVQLISVSTKIVVSVHKDNTLIVMRSETTPGVF